MQSIQIKVSPVTLMINYDMGYNFNRVVTL